MKRGLPVRWIRWRRYRHQALIAEGAGHAAWDLATGEAKGRRRIACIIGYKAALKAELQYIVTGDEVRFVLTGDVAELNDKQRAKLDKWSRRTEHAT